jgi:hypothetical protein
MWKNNTLYWVWPENNYLLNVTILNFVAIVYLTIGVGILTVWCISLEDIYPAKPSAVTQKLWVFFLLGTVTRIFFVITWYCIYHCYLKAKQKIKRIFWMTSPCIQAYLLSTYFEVVDTPPLGRCSKWLEYLFFLFISFTCMDCWQKSCLSAGCTGKNPALLNVATCG